MWSTPNRAHRAATHSLMAAGSLRSQVRVATSTPCSLGARSGRKRRLVDIDQVEVGALAREGERERSPDTRRRPSNERLSSPDDPHVVCAAAVWLNHRFPLSAATPALCSNRYNRCPGAV